MEISYHKYDQTESFTPNIKVLSFSLCVNCCLAIYIYYIKPWIISWCNKNPLSLGYLFIHKKHWERKKFFQQKKKETFVFCAVSNSIFVASLFFVNSIFIWQCPYLFRKLLSKITNLTVILGNYFICVHCSLLTLFLRISF